MNGKAWRNEIKYVCSQAQLLQIEYNIRNICKLDSHTDENGKYLVRSLYFDDHQDTCLRENENGIDPRKKYRIRIYNASIERISVECKHKKQGMTQKESSVITEQECIALMNGRHIIFENDDAALLKRFFVEISARGLLPKVIVQYERTAYVYPAGNVRITFDRNISMSGKTMDFLHPFLTVCPVMPAGYHVLEIKYDDFFPAFLYNAMQICDLMQTPYSKYYISRRLQYL